MCVSVSIQNSRLTSWPLEFGHFPSVNLSQPQLLSFFKELFQTQLSTLKKIEEEDERKNSMQVQPVQVGRQLIFFFPPFVFYVLVLTVPVVCTLALFERAFGV